MKAKHLEKIEIPRNGKVTDALGVLGKLGLETLRRVRGDGVRY